MTTSKITSGCYKGIYKGQEVFITSFHSEQDKKTMWRFEINGKNSGNDWASKKAHCIEDAMDMIDNPTHYGLELK